MSSKTPRTLSIHADSREPDPAEPFSVKRRIFIVDDHAMFRDGLRRLIDLEPDLTVCGGASDAADGL
jgi:hypothetical protein